MARHCVKWSSAKKRSSKKGGKARCVTIKLKAGKWGARRAIHRRVKIKPSGQWKFLPGKC